MKSSEIVLVKRVRVKNNKSKAKVFANLKEDDVLRIEFHLGMNRYGQGHVTFVNERTGETDTKKSGTVTNFTSEMEFEEVTE